MIHCVHAVDLSISLKSLAMDQITRFLVAKMLSLYHEESCIVQLLSDGIFYNQIIEKYIIFYN